jgi:hypothetical protein
MRMKETVGEKLRNTTWSKKERNNLHTIKRRNARSHEHE